MGNMGCSPGPRTLGGPREYSLLHFKTRFDRARHSLQYFYTAVSGVTDFPEFTIVGLVDDGQFMYFDSNIKKAVPKTEWMRQKEGADYWDRQTQIAIRAHQENKINIQVAKERFNQSSGVHTVQLMYGCEWDDETGATDGFKQYGYDEEDFLTMDLKEMRYISPVQQGFITAQKWNNNRAQLENDKQYHTTECIEWLKKYLDYGKSDLGKKVSPQVSLLQKDPSSPLACHATGFYPSGVKITWMRNGQEHEEDVYLGQILPNEGGTFQRTSTLTVKPDELKQFSCVVEHQGKTIIVNEIRINKGGSALNGIIIGVIVGVAILFVVTGVVGYKVYQKKGKSGFVPANSSDSGSDHSSAHSTDSLIPG